MPYIDRPAPSSGLDGKFSWQYTATLALLDGQVKPATFTDQRRFAADVEALLQRFNLIVDTGISGAFDQMYVEIKVYRTDGRIVTARCDAPIGSWRRPVGVDSIMGKAKNLLESMLGFEKMQAMLDAAAKPPEHLEIRELLMPLR